MLYKTVGKNDSKYRRNGGSENTQETNKMAKLPQIKIEQTADEALLYSLTAEYINKKTKGEYFFSKIKNNKKEYVLVKMAENGVQEIASYGDEFEPTIVFEHAGVLSREAGEFIEINAGWGYEFNPFANLEKKEEPAFVPMKNVNIIKVEYATDKQISYMERHQIPYPNKVTKFYASRLIKKNEAGRVIA